MAAGDAQEEVTLEFNLNEDVVAALGRIERKLESLDRQFMESGATARASGHEMAEGIEEMEAAADRAAGASDKAGKSSDDLGEKVRKNRKPVDDHTSSLGKWQKALDKTSSKLGGMSGMFKLFKWPVMIAGGMALVQMLVAVGGAAIVAVGNLAPMAGVVGPLAGLFLAAKAAMLVWKVAAEALKPQLDAIKNDWKEVGKQVAAGGLAAGIDNLRTKTSQWTDVTAKGMTRVGADIGWAADTLGNFSQQQDTLDVTAEIWDHLHNIVRGLLNAALTMLPGVLRLLNAMLPASENLTESLNRGASNLNDWLVGWTDSGKAARFFTTQAERAKNMMAGVIAFTAGVINIFRIAGSTTGDLSLGFRDAGNRFRDFTNSADGKNKIRQFFLDIQPVAHELWLLLGAILKGLMSFSTDPSLAPLIAQIRTELLPALFAVLHNFSGPNGLLPALVDLATNVLRILASVDPQGLVLMAQAVAAVAGALAWCCENVPGFSQLLSVILTVLTVLGPLAWIGGKVVSAFRFFGPVFGAAAEGGEKLSASQTALKWIFEKVAGAAKLVGRGLSALWEFLRPVVDWVVKLFRSGEFLSKVFSFLARLLPEAGLAGAEGFFACIPVVGWVIDVVLLLVGVIWWLWDNCEWFRDAVKAVWHAIAAAAVWCWDQLVAGATWFWDETKSIFGAIGRFFMDYLITPIATAATWLWENVIKPVAEFIGAAFTIAFKVAWFIIRAIVYIIAAIILGILWVARQVWDGIVWAASTAWNFLYSNIIKPVADWIVARWNEVKLFFMVLWAVIVAVATVAWNWLYSNVISPVVDWIKARWNEIVGFFTWLWTLIVGLATAANLWIYNNIISPVVTWITARWNEIVGFFTWLWAVIVGLATAANLWIYNNIIAPVVSAIMAVWNPLAAFFGWLWGVISGAAVAAWNGIRDAISAVAGAVKAVWDGIVNAVKGVYNWIADKWNSLPEIHVLGLDFAPPKLPKWLEGGYTAGRIGLAGEVGPEPIVRGSNVIGMAGMNGPEVSQMPRGSHVVPNPATLLGNPGLAKRLPASVAGAVSRALPGYADILGGGARDDTPAADPPRRPDDGSGALAGAVAMLAQAVDERPPPIAVTAGDPDKVRREVRRALEEDRAERERRRRYDY